MSGFELLDRLSLPRRARRWRLKASGMAITGTAGLEAHKITALTFAWGPIGQISDFYPRNAHGAVTVARKGDARKGSSLPKRTRIANVSLNPIPPIANPCCNRRCPEPWGRPCEGAPK